MTQRHNFLSKFHFNLKKSLYMYIFLIIGHRLLAHRELTTHNIQAQKFLQVAPM